MFYTFSYFRKEAPSSSFDRVIDTLLYSNSFLLWLFVKLFLWYLKQVKVKTRNLFLTTWLSEKLKKLMHSPNTHGHQTRQGGDLGFGNTTHQVMLSFDYVVTQKMKDIISALSHQYLWPPKLTGFYFRVEQSQQPSRRPLQTRSCFSIKINSLRREAVLKKIPFLKRKCFCRGDELMWADAFAIGVCCLSLTRCFLVS